MGLLDHSTVAHPRLSDPEQSQKELIESWAGAKSSCRKLIFPTKISDVCGYGHGIVLIKHNNNNKTSTAIHSSVTSHKKKKKKSTGNVRVFIKMEPCVSHSPVFISLCTSH